MKIKIDKEKCLKCGTCVSLYPEYFRFDDEGNVEIIDAGNVPEDIIRQALSTCPVEAISHEE